MARKEDVRRPCCCFCEVVFWVTMAGFSQWTLMTISDAFVLLTGVSASSTASLVRIPLPLADVCVGARRFSWLRGVTVEIHPGQEQGGVQPSLTKV